MNLSTLLAIFTLLGSSSHGERILSLMYHNASSHSIWISSLLYALAERGHEVTSVDIKLPERTHPNLKTLLLEPVQKGQTETVSDRFRSLSDDRLFPRVASLASNIIDECSLLYERSPYKTFIKPDFNERFDVVLTNFGNNPCPLVLLHFLDYPPVIAYHPITHNPHFLTRVVNTPIYQPVPHFLHLEDEPLSTWKRLVSLAVYLFDDYLYFNKVVPGLDAAIRKQVGKHVPSVKDLTEHICMAFVNLLEFEAHPPFPANVVAVGGMHLTPSKPLPEDLQEYLDNASNGVILVSFGATYSQAKMMDTKKQEAFVRVFSRLPQKVIWRQDKKAMEGIDVPPNVKLVSWFPQNDVLGHPNTVLFLSHCGGLSTMEAAYHGVPVLGIGSPFLADQKFNADKLVTTGVGLKTVLKDVTEDSLFRNVTELLTNPKYRQAAQRYKELLRDPSFKPLEKAVVWVERIAKHGRIPGFRLPKAQSIFQLPSQHIIILDIVLATIAVILSVVIVILVFWFFIKMTLDLVFGPQESHCRDKKTQ